MKSILFASTALVAFAGAAAAQGVTLTGNAEMGIISGNGGVAPTDDNVEFFTDIDVTFTMAGETDNGLTFGASVDLDEGGDGSDAVDNNREDGGATIFLSGNFGTITMGDTDGALDWALTEVAFNSGSINDDETEHAGYNGNGGLDATYDNQVLRYDYSFGDFGVALSAEIEDDDPLVPGDEDGDVLGLGVKYGLDLGGSTVNFGLGYQESDDADAIGFSVSGSFSGVSLGLSMLNRDSDIVGQDYDHIGVGVGYTTGAISVSANYGEYDYETGGVDRDGFGLSAGYDLGGGAIVQLGYGDSNFDGGVGDRETVSFGVRMNF
ncbi:porin [Jannaschia formosa]|uniref:porin n=1 Tax=Jannaschia formosa TaxID=2259592 RepID=UPI000E1B56BD|nr:porin [Jannaschia formosa]TFL20003.1 porin [Jannaschia formosa]